MNEHWNRCDVCGKFISFDDLAMGKARRELVTPDTAFTAETYETLCAVCFEKDNEEGFKQLTKLMNEPNAG